MCRMTSLVDKWDVLRVAVDRLTSDIIIKQGFLVNDANMLGKHINPGNQAVDETITCWVRVDSKTERLLCSKLLDTGDYSVFWRCDKRDA